MVSYKEFEEKLQELRYGRTRISFFSSRTNRRRSGNCEGYSQACGEFCQECVDSSSQELESTDVKSSRQVIVDLLMSVEKVTRMGNVRIWNVNPLRTEFRQESFYLLATFFHQVGEDETACIYYEEASRGELADANLKITGFSRVILGSYYARQEKHEPSWTSSRFAVTILSRWLATCAELTCKWSYAIWLPSLSSEVREVFTALAVAYHNLAIEEEHFQRDELAFHYLKLGYNILYRTKGEESALLSSLLQPLQSSQLWPTQTQDELLEHDQQKIAGELESY